MNRIAEYFKLSIIPFLYVLLLLPGAHAAPSITLNSPPDDSITTNQSMTLDFDVSDTSPMTVKIYGDTSSNPSGLISVEGNFSSGNITFDWEQLYLTPDSYTMGLWHFNSAVSNTVYDEVNGNNGTLQNGAVLSADGKFGYGIEFDGSKSRVNIPDNSSLDVDSANGALTIEAWIYPHQVGSGRYRTIVGKRQLPGGATNYQFSIDASTGKLLFYSGHWPAVNISTVTIPANQWSYVAVSLDAQEGMLRFYRNGVKQDSISNAVFGQANSHPLLIGYVDTDIQTFDGVIDEVRLSSRVLADDEVSANYELGFARYYWKVVADNGTDSTVSETIDFLVDDPENALPVLSAIGPQSATEGIELTIELSAYDNESTPQFSMQNAPSGANLSDHSDGTATFTWTPTFLQGGNYFDITFVATDDSSATDDEVVRITVSDAGNQLPVLASIGPRSITEGNLLEFTITASDPESTPSLEAINAPSGSSFTDHGNGTGTFSWTPGYLESGIFNVTFRATDDSTATDDEVVQIEVLDAGNQLPVLASIGSKSISEGNLLEFTISAGDPESTPSLEAINAPSGSSFTDHGNGTATFSWTPGYLESNTYNVTFRATDDSTATDDEVVQIEVLDAGNQLPVLASIGSKSISEGNLLEFTISASDQESTPSLETINAPTGSSFTDHGNGTGTFSWTPGYLELNIYNVTFRATDDSTAIDDEIVQIEVFDAGNQNPVLASIGAQNATENVQLTFGISATDIESVPSLDASGLPPGASFTDNHNGTGSFDWTPSYLQGGSNYNVTFTATDDSSATDFEIVTISVAEAGNQSPVLAAIGPQNGTEGLLLTINIDASDAESVPELNASNLPAGADFEDNLDGTGTFSWTPTYLQGDDTYNVTFTATDDSSATDFEVVAISIADAGNQPPELAAIGARSVTEGDLLEIEVSAGDAESTPSLEAINAPAGSSFTDHGNGTGTFSWTPGYLESNIYNVTFRATDDSTATDDEIVQIEVFDAGNQNPTLDPIGPKSTSEGTNLNFVVTGSDIEGAVSLTALPLPAGADFVDFGNGTGSFVWTPNYLQSGINDITFTATDDSGGVDIEVVRITVDDAGNRHPVLAAIGDRSTTEGGNLNFNVSATDVESTPTFTVNQLPDGANFTDHGNGTATFDWTPDYLQSGDHLVDFVAVDDSGAVDFEIITISVADGGNRSPVLASIGAQDADEGVQCTLEISASDIESIPDLTASSIPTGAQFTDHNDGTATFSWLPGYLDAGNHEVTFTATDDSGAVDFEVVDFNVNDAGTVLAFLSPEEDTLALDSMTILELRFDSQDNLIQPLAGFTARIEFDNTRLELSDPQRGDFLNDPGSDFQWQFYEPNILIINDSRVEPGGVIGSGILATIPVKGLDGGMAIIDLTHFVTVDTGGTAMEISLQDTSIAIDDVFPILEPPAEPEDHFYLDPPVFGTFCFSDNWALAAGYYQIDAYDPGGWNELFSDWNGTSWVTNDWELPGFDLLSGEPHTLYFMLTDDAGNVNGRGGEVSWRFYKDETAPGVFLLSPPFDSVSQDPAMHFEFSVFDSNAVTAWLYADTLPSADKLLRVFTAPADSTVLYYDMGRLPFEVDPASTSALWHFDEGTGIAVYDESSNNNHGTLMNGAAWTIDGQFGGAVLFDGDNDYISIPDNPSLDIDSASGAMTFEAWIYPYQTADAYRTILAKRVSAQTNYQVSLDQATGNVLFYSGQWPEVFVSNVHPSINQWSYIAVSLDATEGMVRFYYNGQKLDSIPDAVFGHANTAPLMIGALNNGEQEFLGLIDEVRISNHVLNDIDILTRYNMLPAEYYWKVEASDGTNYAASELGYFEIVSGPDTESPSIVVTNPPPNQLLNFIPTIEVHCHDNYGLDSAFFLPTSCTSPFKFALWDTTISRRDTTVYFKMGSANPGTNAFYFKVYDDAGLVNNDSCSYSWSFIYDPFGPRVTVSYPEENQAFEVQPELIIRFEANRGIDRAYYQYDACDGPWIPMWNYNSAGTDTTIGWLTPYVSPGQHSIYFKVVDDQQVVNGDTCYHSWDYRFAPEGMGITLNDPMPGGTFFGAPELSLTFYTSDGIDRAYYQIGDCHGDWTELWDYNSGTFDTTITWSPPDLGLGDHGIYFMMENDLGEFTDGCDFYFWYTQSDFICDCVPGEVNAIDPINVLDIVYMVNYKFKSGPTPQPYTICSGDADCNCIVNILDILLLVNYKFKGGPPPCNCEDWVGGCGAPLE